MGMYVCLRCYQGIDSFAVTKIAALNYYSQFRILIWTEEKIHDLHTHIHQYMRTCICEVTSSTTQLWGLWRLGLKCARAHTHIYETFTSILNTQHPKQAHNRQNVCEGRTFFVIFLLFQEGTTEHNYVSAEVPYSLVYYIVLSHRQRNE